MNALSVSYQVVMKIILIPNLEVLFCAFVSICPISIYLEWILKKELLLRAMNTITKLKIDASVYVIFKYSTIKVFIW